MAKTESLPPLNKETNFIFLALLPAMAFAALLCYAVPAASLLWVLPVLGRSGALRVDGDAGAARGIDATSRMNCPATTKAQALLCWRARRGGELAQ